MLTKDRLLLKQNPPALQIIFFYLDDIGFGSQSLECSLGRRFHPKDSLIIRLPGIRGLMARAPTASDC